MTPGEIRHLRLSLGMRQVEFGALLRAHATTVSRWESDDSENAPDPWQLSVMGALRDDARLPTAELAARFLAEGRIGEAFQVLFERPRRAMRPPAVGPRRGRGRPRIRTKP